MSPPKQLKKLFLEFCKFIDQNENYTYSQLFYNYEKVDYTPETYTIKTCYNYICVHFFNFIYEPKTLEVIDVFKLPGDNQKQKLINEWIKFLRKKKLNKING